MKITEKSSETTNYAKNDPKKAYGHFDYSDFVTYKTTDQVG